MYDWRDGRLEWREPHGANLHVEVSVRDAADGRFVPGARVLATLISVNGEQLGPYEQPLLWHPMVYHYGRNRTVPDGDDYTVRVRVEPRRFSRHDEANGYRFTDPVEVEVSGVPLMPGHTLDGAHEVPLRDGCLLRRSRPGCCVVLEQHAWSRTPAKV
jgi:hypothetical protein